MSLAHLRADMETMHWVNHGAISLCFATQDTVICSPTYYIRQESLVWDKAAIHQAHRHIASLRLLAVHVHLFGGCSVNHTLVMSGGYKYACDAFQ